MFILITTINQLITSGLNNNFLNFCSNGLLDPWSSGGVLHSKLNSIVSVVIPNAAHHLDLRPTNAKDPLSIKKARRKYFKIFRKWIKHYYKK